MDTDDLTAMAYRTISLAGEFCDFLKCDIGVLAKQCSSEGEYLKEVQGFLDEIILDPEEYLESWSLDDEFEPEWFRQRVQAIAAHVAEVLDTPTEERGACSE